MILATERLALRKLALADAEFIIALVNDPAWLRNIGDRNVHCIADAERYLTNGPMSLYEKLGVGLWAVVLRETSQCIGMCGLIKRDALEDFDLGFAFLPVYRGQGYAMESASGVLRYAQEVMRLPRLAAIVNRENEPSIRLLQKLGFMLTGELQLPGESEQVNHYHLTF
jgi:ribosomal-protein-alanine N-acetyltransferase